MGGHPLGVQEFEAARAEVLNERDESDLRCVSFPGKHAFSEENSGQFDSIEAALQTIVIPAFDGVGVSQLVKIAVAFQNGVINPCFIAGRTGEHHFPEGGIAADFEGISLERALEPVGNVKTPVEGNQAAALG